MKNEHNCIATIRKETATESLYGSCNRAATIGVNTGHFPLYYCRTHFKSHAGNPKYTSPIVSAWDLETFETV